MHIRKHIDVFSLLTLFSLKEKGGKYQLLWSKAAVNSSHFHSNFNVFFLNFLMCTFLILKAANLIECENFALALVICK